MIVFPTTHTQTAQHHHRGEKVCCLPWRPKERGEERERKRRERRKRNRSSRRRQRRRERIQKVYQTCWLSWWHAWLIQHLQYARMHLGEQSSFIQSSEDRCQKSEIHWESHFYRSSLKLFNFCQTQTFQNIIKTGLAIHQLIFPMVQLKSNDWGKWDKGVHFCRAW